MALGSCTSIQNFYEIKRERNQELLKNAELIITESNINEINNSAAPIEKIPLALIYKNLSYFYKELYFLKKKVLVCLLPFPYGAYKIINNIHRKLCLKYGFNLIDMQSYYENLNLVDFDRSAHQLSAIMREFGRRIITSLNDFNSPKNLNIINDNPQFKICIPKDMKLLNGTLEEINMKNSLYDEQIFRLTKETKIQFPKEFEGYFVIGVHTWNKGGGYGKFFNEYSSLILENQKTSISKESNCLNVVLEFHNDFLIDEQSYALYNQNDNARFKEYFHAMGSWHQNAKRVEYCDIIAFFLASDNELRDKEDLELLENLATLSNLTIELPKEYDFSHLIPPVEVYKEIIEEYCARMDPRKLAPLQKQIKFGTATQRIHNHLAYKLGQIIIRNSKSLYGFIKLPYLLMALTLIHKEQEKIYKEKIKANPNLALPPLESYKDYKEALKEKECFTYKLGSAFIKASKSWYKGGFIQFFFEAKSLYKEFKSKKAKQE